MLENAVDFHIHTAPDVNPRLLNDIEAATQAKEAGMRAIIIKSHHTLTADRASMARKLSGFEVYGGLALNYPVGGLNLTAVETAVKFGAKQIWMPTMHAENCMRKAKVPMFVEEAKKFESGISVLDDKGDLIPDVLPILEIIRDADIILSTGHLSVQESLTLVRKAGEMGAKKLLITHPHADFTRFSRDQMKGAVSYGAMLELDFLNCTESVSEPISPAFMAGTMREVGVENCVMATDSGQKANPPPVEMFQKFALKMKKNGISEGELRIMMCDNPARLLGI